MKKKRRVLNFVLLALAVGALCWGVIYVWSNSIINSYQPGQYPRNGLSDFDPGYTGYYKIVPDTILATLDHGETDVFGTETATPAAPVFNSPIFWHQADYLRITNAVFEFTWKETIDNWNLLSMEYHSTCRDSPDGFTWGDLHFFKAKGASTYTTREVIVTPQYADVAWGGGGEGADFPRPSSDWKSIDLSLLKITADDALRIAEETGGKSFRLAKGNQCSLFMILTINNNNNWFVEYEGNDGLSNLDIKIDPYSGEVISGKTFISTSKPSP